MSERLVTMVPIEHDLPLGTRVRSRHGRRVAEIVAVEIAYCGPAYRIRYVDNRQEAIRRIEELEYKFDVVTDE